MTLSSTNGGPISLSKTEFDPGGRVTWQMDARGGMTAYGYDSAGQRIAVTNYPGWSRTYTGAYTNLLGVTTYPPTNAVAIVTGSVYDPNGNVAQEIDPLGNTTSYFYDESNRRVATLFPAIGTNAPAATQTVYDSLGRKVQDIDEAGVVTAFGYDALGRLISVTNDALAGAGVTNLVTTYSYDAAGNLVTQTDALGRASLFEYDAFGRRTRRIWPGSTNINDYLSGTNANPAVEVTTYTNVPSETSGVSVWERRVRDGRGLTVVTDEDVVGRVATVGFPTIYQGSATLRTSRTNRFTYTVAGMIDHVDTVDSSGTLRTTYYKYDDARRRRQADSPEGVLTWQRDAQGNIIAMQGYRRSAVAANAEVTGGTTTDVDVAYGYDAMNRLSSVTDRKVSTTRSLGYAFDAAGRVQTATYPNGATNRFVYDARHRLLKTDWWQTNGTLMRAFSYTLGAGGVRVAVNESDPTNSSRRSISWQYDVNGTNQFARLYRLTSETITNLGSLGTEQHVYDLVGNRLSRAVTGFITNSVPTNSAWSDNARDELNVDTYDGAGNTTLGTSLSLANTDSYDAENHLILRGTNTSPVVQIDYDAFGNRVKKTAGGTTIWYLVDDQSPSGYQQVVAEFNSLTSAPLRTYAYGLSLIDIVGGGTTSYALTDGQGSVRALFSDTAAASLTDNYDFDAYGVLTTSTGSTVNNYRYTGQQWDPDLQLYYLRARYYAPTLGRFWSSDSYEGQLEEPASLYKYIYVYDNPCSGIDPSGHDFTLGELNIVESIQTTLQTLKTQGPRIALRAARTPIYNVYYGFAAIPPFGHSGIFVGGKLGQMQEGWLFHVLPSPGGEIFRSRDGIIRKQGPYPRRAFQTTFPLNFKFTEFSEIEYIFWQAELKIIAAMNDDVDTPIQYSELGFIGRPFSCHSWAAKAMLSAVATSRRVVLK